MKALRRAWAATRAWWAGLEASERVLYRALALLAGGFAMWIPPLALIVPGLVLTLVFFGFSLRRAE